MPDTRAAEPAPAVKEATHLRLPVDFEDAVPLVQVEHELAGFETVSVTRVDEMVAAALGGDLPRTALVTVCHAEVAREALAVDPRLAGLLPCTTAVYERPDDDAVHVHHVSATKAARDLGCAPDAAAELEAVVELTADRMADVWANLRGVADGGG